MPKTAANDISIRRGTPEDTARIVDFLRLVLGEGTIPRTEGYWQWKHVENPFGASPVLLAEAAGGENAGQLVGLRAFMRWRFMSGSRAVEAVRAVDTATHPDWRGRGIFTRLTLQLVEEMREEGVAFVFNTPNAKSRPGYLKMGWEDVGSVSLWVRVLRPGRFVQTLASGRGRPEEETNLRPGAYEGVEAALGEPGLEHLLAACAPRDGRYATPRTVDYLRWRYAAIPELDYRALWDLGGGRGALLAFRKRTRGGLHEMDLGEVLVHPSPEGMHRGRALLRHLARTAEADYLVAMAPWDTPARHALLFSGFVPAPRLGPRLTTRRLAYDEEEPPLPDPRARASWHLSVGDVELF